MRSTNGIIYIARQNIIIHQRCTTITLKITQFYKISTKLISIRVTMRVADMLHWNDVISQYYELLSSTTGR